MANVTAKTSSNIFYKARCEAATHNEQLFRLVDGMKAMGQLTLRARVILHGIAKI